MKTHSSSQRENCPTPAYDLLVASFLMIAFAHNALLAQQFIPREWQRDSTAYAANPWVRDANGNRIDDLIEARLGRKVDIVVDLNRFVPRDTLLKIYQSYTTDSSNIFIDNFVSFLFVPAVLADTVIKAIIKREEVFLVEYAGKFRSALDQTIPSMAIRPGSDPEFYRDNVESRFRLDPNQPLTGNGIGIIILDSGVDDVGHQAFASAPPMLTWSKDFSMDLLGVPGNPAGSGHRHATIMALVAFGRGATSGLTTTHRGVATCGTPGVQWGDVKVFDERIQVGQAVLSATRFNHMQAGFNHVISLAETHPTLKIVNMSFSQFEVDNMGTPTAPLRVDGNTEAFNQLVNYAMQRGLVCVASAGNNALFSEPAGLITPPGSAFGAITVGASTTGNSPNRELHRVARISSFGPLDETIDEMSSYRWKPDITAPGMYSDTPSTLGLILPTSTSAPGTYRENTIVGSSIAAAHVSGLAALMLEYTNRNLTPACLKDALMRNAHLLTTFYPQDRRAPNMDWNSKAGTGFVNAYAAFQYLKKTDLAITFLDWQEPPIVDRSNRIIAKVKNLGNTPDQTASNINIDFFVDRFGVGHPAYSYVGSYHLPTLLPGEELPAEISVRITAEYISPASPSAVGIPHSTARAEIRYGGDITPSNNSRSYSESTIATDLLVGQEINPDSDKQRPTSAIEFEIYNPLMTAVNVKLKEVERPPTVSISYSGVPDIAFITLQPVNKPPVRIRASIDHPTQVEGIIRLQVQRVSNSSVYGDLVIRLAPTVSVDERSLIPSTFILERNFPNPFASTTQIRFFAPISGNISMEIYNLMGQRVRTLLNQKLPPGKQHVTWDGADDSGKRVVPGIYFYRLHSEKFVQTKKMVLLH